MTTESILRVGQILSFERRAHMTDDEALRFSRAIEQAVLQSPEIQALRKDAERYRRLRGMTWHSSPLCVASIPKKSVRPGFDCPSGDRLDAAIDAVMEHKK